MVCILMKSIKLQTVKIQRTAVDASLSPHAKQAVEKGIDRKVLLINYPPKPEFTT